MSKSKIIKITSIFLVLITVFLSFSIPASASAVAISMISLGAIAITYMTARGTILYLENDYSFSEGLKVLGKSIHDKAVELGETITDQDFFVNKGYAKISRKLAEICDNYVLQDIKTLNPGAVISSSDIEFVENARYDSDYMGFFIEENLSYFSSFDANNPPTIEFTTATLTIPYRSYAQISGYPATYRRPSNSWRYSPVSSGSYLGFFKRQDKFYVVCAYAGYDSDIHINVADVCQSIFDSLPTLTQNIITLQSSELYSSPIVGDNGITLSLPDAVSDALPDIITNDISEQAIVDTAQACLTYDYIPATNGIYDTTLERDVHDIKLQLESSSASEQAYSQSQVDSLSGEVEGALSDIGLTPPASWGSMFSSIGNLASVLWITDTQDFIHIPEVKVPSIGSNPEFVLWNEQDVDLSAFLESTPIQILKGFSSGIYMLFFLFYGYRYVEWFIGLITFGLAPPDTLTDDKKRDKIFGNGSRSGYKKG